MSFSLTSKSRSNPLCAPYYHAFDLRRNTQSSSKVVVVSRQTLDKYGREVAGYDLKLQERSLWGKVSKAVKSGFWMVPVVGHVAYGLFKAGEKVGLSGKLNISKLDQQRRTYHLTEFMADSNYEPLLLAARNYKLQQAKELYVSERHRDEIQSFDDLRQYLLDKFDRIVSPDEFDEAYQKLFSDYPEVQFTMDDLHSIVDFKKFEIFRPADLMAIKEHMASELENELSIRGVLGQLRVISSQSRGFLEDLNGIFSARDRAIDRVYRQKERALKKNDKSNDQIEAEFNKKIEKALSEFEREIALIVIAQRYEYNTLSTVRRKALCDIKLDMSNNLEDGNISELESGHVQLILSRLEYLAIPHTLNPDSSMEEVLSWFHQSIMHSQGFHEAKTLRMVLNQMTLKSSVYSEILEEVQLHEKALGKNLDLPEEERGALDEETRNLQIALDNYRRFLSGYEKIFNDPEASKHSENYILSTLNQPFQELIAKASRMMSDFQMVNRVANQLFKQFGKNLLNAKAFIDLADKHIRHILGDQRLLSSNVYKPYIHSVYKEHVSSMSNGKPRFASNAAVSAPTAGVFKPFSGSPAKSALKKQGSPIHPRRRVSFSGIPGVETRSSSEPVLAKPRPAAPAAEPIISKKKKTVSFA